MKGPSVFSRQNVPAAITPPAKAGVPKKSPLKPEVAGIIAQTDASGEQYRVPHATDSSSLVEEHDEEDSSSWASFLWSCCVRKKPDDDRTKSTSALPLSRTPSNARRQAHWPMPEIMPQCGEVAPGDRGKKCLVLDLDETLVHSSTDYMHNADYVIPVDIDGSRFTIYVRKRPGVDEFLRRMERYYEVIVFTASLSKYADPLLDMLDVHKVVRARLFREHCVFYQGHFVKDLSVINRPIDKSILIDNSPQSYIFQPENAIDCSSFFEDPNDDELARIGDFLEGIHDCRDVRALCRHWREWLIQHPREDRAK